MYRIVVLDVTNNKLYQDVEFTNEKLANEELKLMEKTYPGLAKAYQKNIAINIYLENRLNKKIEYYEEVK